MGAGGRGNQPFHLAVADRAFLRIFSRKGLDQFKSMSALFTLVFVKRHPYTPSTLQVLHSLAAGAGWRSASSLRRTSVMASVACSAARTEGETRPSICTTASALC